jgi:rare lipoprotein A
MAGVPLLTLLHAAPPPEAMSAQAVAARGEVALAVGADSSRPVDNRVSRSDVDVPTTEVPTTTEAVPDTTPTTAAPAARTTRTTRTTVKPVQKQPARAATATTKPAPKPAAKPAPKSAPAPSSSAAPAPSGRTQSGGATWYDAAPPGTCAHRTLPMGTMVTIRSQSTGATATCRVSDRGPFVDGLIIDLAKDVFSKLAPMSQGVVQVTISW